jgi:hypothetical protein
MLVTMIADSYQYLKRTHHLRRVSSRRNIDPEGGSDGEQLDASLTVFSDKKISSERRERQLDAHLPDWRKRKKEQQPTSLVRHDIHPGVDPEPGIFFQDYWKNSRAGV